MKLSELPKAELSWVKALRESTLSFRRVLVRTLLEGIKEFKSGRDNKAGQKLFDQILKSGSFELVGITTCVPYIKVEGSKDDLKQEYIHPFGMPTLLYHIKNTPAFLLVNPGLRFNSNILKEIEKNKYDEDVKGITS